MKTFFVVFLIMLNIGVFAQSSEEGFGVIKELSGTVELKTDGATNYVPAKAGDTIAQNTIIYTALKSMALVEVGSTVIVVRPMTRLTLTEISASHEAETLHMNLQAGRVRVDVNPPTGTKTTMDVKSPMAVASVRGTSFYFDTRNLYVDHGTVFFKGNKGYTVQVSEGSVSGVAAGNGKASAPQVVTTSSSVSAPQIITESPGSGLEPPSPVGKDPSSAAGNTGGAGTILPDVPFDPPNLHDSPGDGEVELTYPN